MISLKMNKVVKSDGTFGLRSDFNNVIFYVLKC